MASVGVTCACLYSGDGGNGSILDPLAGCEVCEDGAANLLLAQLIAKETDGLIADPLDDELISRDELRHGLWPSHGGDAAAIQIQCGNCEIHHFAILG